MKLKGTEAETESVTTFSFVFSQVLLDDHIIKTLSMRGSAFVKPCEREVRNWYEKLLRVAQIFDEWLKVQTNWLYLLPILSSKDILIEMPNEERLFYTVNEIYCKYIEVNDFFFKCENLNSIKFAIVSLFVSDGYKRASCNENDRS